MIGDVHGNFDTLMALLDMIPQEEKDKGIILAGDLIDRGPKSMQIVQWCINNQDKVKVVRGNHEEMMVGEALIVIDFVAKTGLLPRGARGSLWTVNGGYETLKSYELLLDDELDERGLPTRVFDHEKLLEHANWMNTLPYYLEFPNIKNEEGRYLVVSHSNVNNVWGLRDSQKSMDKSRFQSETTWGRPHQIKDVPDIYNIVGHTPQEHGPRIRKIYACVDTGCFYTTGGFGRLTALQYPEMIIYEHENIDSKVGHVPFKNILTLEELNERNKRNRR